MIYLFFEYIVGEIVGENGSVYPYNAMLINGVYSKFIAKTAENIEKVASASKIFQKNMSRPKNYALNASTLPLSNKFYDYRKWRSSEV